MKKYVDYMKIGMKEHLVYSGKGKNPGFYQTD